MDAIHMPLFAKMEPTLLIIPLIAVAIWVLQYLFRSANEKKPNDRSRSSSRSSSKPRKQDPSFDRYLDDARREREREQELSKSRRSQSSRGVPVRTAPLPVLEVAVEEHQRGSLEKRLEAREAHEPKHVDTPAVAAVAVPVVPDAPVVPQRLGKVRAQSPAVLELARLLRSPVSIRAAIILNEVLGPPLSRRNAAIDRPL